MDRTLAKMEYPDWLIYPSSKARLTVTRTKPAAVVAMIANPEGLASFSAVLLWLTAFSDPSGLSVSGLPFVTTDGPLALSIALELEPSAFQGRLRLLDKLAQYEWQVHDEVLQPLAVSLHQLASHWTYNDYLDVNLSPDSDASLRFEVDAHA